MLQSWWLRFGLFTLAFAALLVTALPKGRAILWALGLAAAASTAIGILRFSALAVRHRRLVLKPGSLEDGRVAAVCGVLEPLGEPLRTPVLGRPAVVYHYSAWHYVSSISKSSPNERVDYAGYGATPAVIRGTRLGAFPTLEGIGEKNLESDAARQFLRAARFDELPKGEMIEYVWVIENMWDGRERVAKNFRRGDGHDLDQCRFNEHSIAPGTEVCAVGIWSAAHEALISGKDQDLTLYEGAPEKVAETLSGSTGCGVFGGVLVLAAVAVALYLLLT